MVITLLYYVLSVAAVTVEWSQTARMADGSLVLLEEKKPFQLLPSKTPPADNALVVDTSKSYQTFAGFGGAFTEATAINWRKLSASDQAKVIRLYFADPKEGGLGYTMGRVPINSCDFSPSSYTFDDEEGDIDLKHFDSTVQHDVDNGMVPMIKAAVAAAKDRGVPLKLVASPWSPPAWMKKPVQGIGQSMTASAKPDGLLPEMQRPWAKYFSKWLSAYKAYGIDYWAVTVQNEPEATAGWESMLWSPKFMASFVRDHLGPVLKAEQPDVKIIGFDHNKDHVIEWATGLYKDPEAAKYFSGVGVHWYGGLNTDKLQAAHDLAPDKFLLATEACNCVGNVVFSSPNLAAWWTRAEKLALDILEDLRFWCVGWIDWNLLVDTEGGPNHLKNLCDANIIVDAENKMGTGSPLIRQASFYYMGHFSRYLLPGSKRVELKQTVETEIPPLAPADIKNGVALSFLPCDDSNEVQRFRLIDGDTLVADGTNDAPGSDGYQIGGECVEFCISGECWFPKVQLWACGKTDPLHGKNGNQKWKLVPVEGGTQIVNTRANQCLTATEQPGWAVGLDAGVTVVAAQLRECYPAGKAPNQTFTLEGNGADGGDGPAAGSSFFIRSAFRDGMCLQPQLEKLPHFDGVAFEQPDGSVSLVVMNTNDNEISFTIRDEGLGAQAEHAIPAHAIHTYRWKGGAGGGGGRRSC